ncbi:MAG TPA: magnesium-translocating P-type ATPase [Nocardioides sp.]|nr:magnesium-translocating P-type ATPase [Nocardioides sp.]
MATELDDAAVRDAQPDVPQVWWAAPVDDVLHRLGITPAGLSEREAEERLDVLGLNRLGPPRRRSVVRELVRQFSEPIVLILVAATGISLLAGDHVDAFIILTIVVLSGLLGFVQEHRASVIVERLLDQVQIQVEVRRRGKVVSVLPERVAPGDVVVLNAGDIVPCDCRVISAEALELDESALTGETYPRHKRADPAPADAALTERHSALFQGTHVVSGKGEAVAVVTGAGTELGQAAKSLAATSPRTSFELGSRRLGLLLARVTVVLSTAILLLNIGLGRPLIEALLFSLALAVGVTPQMLPAIVAVSLSAGARRLARQKVIVRRLDAIEDLGSMDVLCTDKTGTLTEGRITLASAVDLEGRPDDVVAERAAVNAQLQSGFTNPLDVAVLAHRTPAAGWHLVAELPFDFDRKRLSVLADDPDGHRVLVTKGAFTKVLDVCATVATGGGVEPLSAHRERVEELYRSLSAQGYRVLAVAERDLAGRTSVDVTDEQGLTLRGLLAFDDPPKEQAGETVRRLRALGVRLCVLTGDNALAAAHVAEVLGEERPTVLTGPEIDAMDDRALAHAVARTDVFAELTPAQKERLIEAVRSTGSVVGYLGDGINDAGPLHLADVGISVDTAVDVAKSAAALVLLDKDLQVVVEGIRLGRQTFTNTLKYVYTTVSANFGNTASMAAASAFLPFLPLLPRQILLLNFLSDLPSVTLAEDRVDDEDVARPRRWDVHAVRNFMVTFGLLSSAFDLATFAVLLRVFDAGESLFQTGWFIGSTLTEICVLLVLRTRRRFYRSRPGWALVLSSVLVAVVVVAFPYVPDVGDWLGLVHVRWPLVATLVGITAAYVVAAEVTKRFYYRSAPSGFTTAVSGPPPVSSYHRRLAKVAHEHGRTVPTAPTGRRGRRARERQAARRHGRAA